MHANCWVKYNVFLLGFAIQSKYIVGLDVSELLTFAVPTYFAGIYVQSVV